MRLSRKVLRSACRGDGDRGGRGARLRAPDARQAATGQELLSAQNRPSAEGLAGLPKDHTGLPRQAALLGPPLPGDLGKPILNAGTAPNSVTAAASPDPEAARVSRLFSQTSQASPGAGQLIPNSSAGTTATPTATLVDAGSSQNMQEHKTAFLKASTDKRTISPDRLEAMALPYVVQAGTVTSSIPSRPVVRAVPACLR